MSLIGIASAHLVKPSIIVSIYVTFCPRYSSPGRGPTRSIYTLPMGWVSRVRWNTCWSFFTKFFFWMQLMQFITSETIFVLAPGKKNLFLNFFWVAPIPKCPALGCVWTHVNTFIKQSSGRQNLSSPSSGLRYTNPALSVRWSRSNTPLYARYSLPASRIFSASGFCFSSTQRMTSLSTGSCFCRSSGFSVIQVSISPVSKAYTSSSWSSFSSSPLSPGASGSFSIRDNASAFWFVTPGRWTTSKSNPWMKFNHRA